jgi:hypothetical protein
MLTMQPPASDRLSDSFGRLRADSWKEPSEQCSNSGLRAPGAEPMAEEVELEHLMVHLTIAISSTLGHYRDRANHAPATIISRVRSQDFGDTLAGSFFARSRS